ncbi:MAG TPA: ABC transporter ATP-binding protein [Candidatus Saccharimonadales bacterium]|nr:ABC transporter ATP-binding protein [Candidatus Saccharimonadales bacterium]
MNNYELNRTKQYKHKTSLLKTMRKFAPLLAGEQLNLIIAFLALIISSALTLATPIIVGITIDTYIQKKQYEGVLINGGILFIIFIGAFFASYIQTKYIGGVGQRLLFTLRNKIFIKLQQLPIVFFNLNKSGDLISRINSDTDNLNQFFSQALMQFIGNLVTMAGAAIFILIINIKLGIPALLPAVLVLVLTQFISPWVKRKNATNLQSVGGMSAEIQESLDNFKVIVAFNRRDYFRKRFTLVNQTNFSTAVGAGVANNIFTPLYGLAANFAQIVVLFYGIYLITTSSFMIGLLISYLSYVNRFYDPIRQIAGLWSSFQLALASWDRISEILALESDLKIIPATEKEANGILEFKQVYFKYPTGKDVLKDINFTLESGKTYALVGPTGGGKTTTASLMARLYDPTKGTVFLDGKDIRSYREAERTKKIGFILQEPFLFTGTVRDNILYGNEDYIKYSNEQLEALLHENKLEGLLERFDQGLDTPVMSHGDAISLGQRQLIAFIRAILRKPELLILDEATANIDTVTEKLLEEILEKLPKETTRVIIAHRLNTIENADVIFFVNSGTITRAGSLKHALSMLLEGKSES